MKFSLLKEIVLGASILLNSWARWKVTSAMNEQTLINIILISPLQLRLKHFKIKWHMFYEYVIIYWTSYISFIASNKLHKNMLTMQTAQISIKHTRFCSSSYSFFYIYNFPCYFGIFSSNQNFNDPDFLPN